MYPFPFTAQAPALGINASASASTSIALPGVGNTIRVVNEGPNIAFVSIGVGAQTATLPATVIGSVVPTSTPVPVGDITLTIPAAANQFPAAPVPLQISAICRATQTAVLTVQVGEGQ